MTRAICGGASASKEDCASWLDHLFENAVAQLLPGTLLQTVFERIDTLCLANFAHRLECIFLNIYQSASELPIRHALQFIHYLLFQTQTLEIEVASNVSNIRQQAPKSPPNSTTKLFFCLRATGAGESAGFF